MEKLKKSLFFLMLTGLVLALVAFIVIFLTKNKENTDEVKPVQVQESQYSVYSIADFKNPATVPEKEKKALTPQLHEGEAFFADVYRLELAIREERGGICAYLLYIDNYWAEPLYPKGTNLSIQTQDKTLPLKVIRNGLLANGMKCPTLPTSVKIKGMLGRKYFDHTVTVKTFRKQQVDYKKNGN